MGDIFDMETSYPNLGQRVANFLLERVVQIRLVDVLRINNLIFVVSGGYDDAYFHR